MQLTTARIENLTIILIVQDIHRPLIQMYSVYINVIVELTVWHLRNTGFWQFLNSYNDL